MKQHEIRLPSKVLPDDLLMVMDITRKRRYRKRRSFWAAIAKR